MNNLIGQTLGKYEIKEKIGQGGMAHVYKAYQPGLDRFVAVKVLSPSLAEQPGFTERFQREALSAARLHHPHILEVYDFGVQDNFYYLVMRYVEGSKTLGDFIQDGAPLDRLINYIIQVADALNYAHERGVIHRDVKPGNILIDGKWALLADFGLAKMAATSSTLTGTGVSIGTPAYMSPEQASGAGTVDHRTDIYALGVILYRILTGSVPHNAPTPLALLARRCTEPVPALREVNPSIPEKLDRAVLRSLVMQPDGRYSTAAHFAEQLEEAKASLDFGQVRSVTIPVITGETALVGGSGDGGAATVSPGAGKPAPTGAPARQSNPGLIVGGLVAAVVVLVAIILVLFFLVAGKGGLFAQSTPQVVTPESANNPAILASDTPSPPADTPTPMPIDTPTRIPPGTPSAIAKADIEVRSGPGDDYELLGYLPEGVTAEIVGRDRPGEWWKIKTSLADGGQGWISAASELSQVTDTDNVPIALAPPTPSPTPVADTPTSTATTVPDTLTPTVTSVPHTPTLTATSVPHTPTLMATSATNTPMSTATPTRLLATATSRPAALPTATRTPSPPAGGFVLLQPTLDGEPSYGPTEFEWQWNGPLGEDQGFEIRVWLDGEPPAGAHNAVDDNKGGKVVTLGNDTYRLTVDIRNAYGVKNRSGEYLWTVILVQISPEYQDLGVQATPGRLRFEGSGGDSEGGGGPSGPPPKDPL
jgi:hypothetical protein